MVLDMMHQINIHKILMIEIKIIQNLVALIVSEETTSKEMKGHTQEIVDQDQEIVYRNQKKKNIETEDRDRDRKIGERKTGTEKIVKKDINIDVVDQDHGTIKETIEDTKIILMTTLLTNLRGIPNIERNRIKSEGLEVVVEKGD